MNLLSDLISLLCKYNVSLVHNKTYTRARQFESISKQVGGKVEGTKKVICSQMDLSYHFSSLIAALSKLLDFRGRL